MIGDEGRIGVGPGTQRAAVAWQLAPKRKGDPDKQEGAPSGSRDVLYPAGMYLCGLTRTFLGEPPWGLTSSSALPPFYSGSG